MQIFLRKAVAGEWTLPKLVLRKYKNFVWTFPDSYTIYQKHVKGVTHHLASTMPVKKLYGNVFLWLGFRSDDMFGLQVCGNRPQNTTISSRLYYLKRRVHYQIIWRCDAYVRAAFRSDFVNELSIVDLIRLIFDHIAHTIQNNCERKQIT